MNKEKNYQDEGPITEFGVTTSGTLQMLDFWEPENRSDFYESAFDSWSASPAHLAEAMKDCQPLAWAVHSIYNEVREQIQLEHNQVNGDSEIERKRLVLLKNRLKSMPNDPEEGAEAWLLTLTNTEFEEIVVPEIESWFDSPPNWGSEDDYLPSFATSQGAALEFFQRMSASDLTLLGVEIVEGEYPGSSYYAAELKANIRYANSAAENNGIPVRFSRSKE